MKVNALQIGSHVGSNRQDKLFSNVSSDDKLILIEPVPWFFEKLKENYDNQYPNNSFIFINFFLIFRGRPCNL